MGHKRGGLKEEFHMHFADGTHGNVAFIRDVAARAVRDACAAHACDSFVCRDWRLVSVGSVV
jgi:hypothetical protein